MRSGASSLSTCVRLLRADEGPHATAQTNRGQSRGDVAAMENLCEQQHHDGAAVDVDRCEMRCIGTGSVPEKSGVIRHYTSEPNLVNKGIRKSHRGNGFAAILAGPTRHASEVVQALHRNAEGSYALDRIWRRWRTRDSLLSGAFLRSGWHCCSCSATFNHQATACALADGADRPPSPRPSLPLVLIIIG